MRIKQMEEESHLDQIYGLELYSILYQQSKINTLYLIYYLTII